MAKGPFIFRVQAEQSDQRRSADFKRAAYPDALAELQERDLDTTDMGTSIGACPA